MATFLKSDQNRGEKEPIESRFLLEFKGIKKEVDDFADQRAHGASPFAEEEEVKGHIVKEKIEKFEVQICSPFETAEDVKLEIKCKELQVSQSTRGACGRKVKNEDISRAITQRSNSPQGARTPSGPGKSRGHSNDPKSRRRQRRAGKGERPCRCSQCGKTFTESRGLKKHKRIHTGERPYRCSQCAKTFIQSAHLTAHRRSHTGEKPYSCPQCGRSFTQSPHLRRHQRSHAGERLYRCAQCAKSFNEKGDLTKHMRIHTGEKPYCCTQCGRSFSYSTNLSKHQQSHKGETS